MEPQNVSYLSSFCAGRTAGPIRAGGRVVIMRSIPRVAVLMEPSRPFERGLIQGIAAYSRLHGPWQFYRKLPYVTGGSELSVGVLRDWRPEGIIVREQKNLAAILELGVPTVIAPSRDYVAGYPNVRSDNQQVGMLGAEHLVDCGLKNFAYCGMDRAFVWSRERRDGFRQRLARAGYDVSVYELPYRASQLAWTRQRRRLVAWLKSLPKPLGLMVCSDDYSLGIFEACAQVGYRIPDDVAMVSVGNDDTICDLTFPPLSSIALNTVRGGYAVAENLARQMAGRRSHSTLVIEPIGVVARGSSDILAIDNPDVARAVRYIQHNSAQRLRVDDVVRATASSRRALYDAFAKATGRSIYRYLCGVRADRAARLLRETTMSVAQVAAELSFPDEKNFARFFRREKAASPRAYRNRSCE